MSNSGKNGKIGKGETGRGTLKTQKIIKFAEMKGSMSNSGKNGKKEK